jgi:dTDP-glucose 4,6-dehydratase
MVILTTGGAGFIGSNFINHWLDSSSTSDEIVINFDKLTYAGNLENFGGKIHNPRHHFIQGDICDSELISRLLAEYHPRAILNFAAESHVDRSIDAPAEFMQTNILGTFTLLQAARSYWEGLQGQEKDDFRFLHVSTDEVYGTLLPADAPFSEETPFAPNSPYAASKASSDHLVRAWHHTFGLPILTTNCSNNYGPFQFPEKLIPLIIMNALSCKPLPIYGDGLQVRDWLYVGDHCRAISAVLAKGRVGETYNIGGNQEMTNLEVVHTLCRVLDALKPKSDGAKYSNQIAFVTDRPGHDRRYAINATKIQKELAWNPVETFETGILKTVEWYLRNEGWINNIRDRSYQKRVSLQKDDVS